MDPDTDPPIPEVALPRLEQTYSFGKDFRFAPEVLKQRTMTHRNAKALMKQSRETKAMNEPDDLKQVPAPEPCQKAETEPEPEPVGHIPFEGRSHTWKMLVPVYADAALNEKIIAGAQALIRTMSADPPPQAPE